MAKCSGGLRTFKMFWVHVFLEMEAFRSELSTGHQEFIQPYKILHKKNKLMFIFAMYQNCTLALSLIHMLAC